MKAIIFLVLVLLIACTTASEDLSWMTPEECENAGGTIEDSFVSSADACQEKEAIAYVSGMDCNCYCCT